MTERPFEEWGARHYDQLFAPMFDPQSLEPSVELLAQLAAPGSALELAIGTGRVALPLAARGIPVQGIELSADMVEQLRAKPGGRDLQVTVGNMATERLRDRFRLVYLVFNTITNLTTQSEQVACFANAAHHLEPSGYFVVEAGVPDLQRLPPGETTRAFDASPHHLGVDEYLDLPNQRLKSHHCWTVDGQTTTFSSTHRFVWPSELDLMAQLAGLTFQQRWADWHRAPFTADSRAHVSVWQKR